MHTIANSWINVQQIQMSHKYLSSFFAVHDPGNVFNSSGSSVSLLSLASYKKKIVHKLQS